MEMLQNVAVARQLAREREASLRRTATSAARGGAAVRRWIGEQLVILGTRLVTDRPMPALAGR